MKKTITILASLIMFGIASVSQAQTPMPNGGFETWTDTVTCDTWSSNNLNLGLFAFNFVKQTTDKHSGTYAASIQTMNALIQVMPGVITLGTYNLLTGPAGGYPITGKPTAVNGFYKYNSVNGDTMAILVVMTKWNIGTSTRDTLSVASYAVASSVAAYTAFSIPLSYNPPAGMPDTVNILGFSSAGSAPQEGSTLFLDDLAFAYSGAGISEITENNFAVFPNPASNQLTISLNNGLENTIQIVSTLGKVVFVKTSTSQFELIDISSLSEGLYYVKISNIKGSVVSKAIISR